MRAIARQLRDKNCPGAIFAPGHQDVSQGPLGIRWKIDTDVGVGARGTRATKFLDPERSSAKSVSKSLKQWLPFASSDNVCRKGRSPKQKQLLSPGEFAGLAPSDR